MHIEKALPDDFGRGLCCICLSQNINVSFFLMFLKYEFPVH